MPKNSLNQKSKTRKYIFGKKDCTGNMTEKTILVVGATGSGKSTLIDGMVNYILDVNWENKWRFTIIDPIGEDKGKERDETISQTEWITCYTIHTQRGRIDYTLNIIDTPGFGDTRGIERDQAHVDQMRDFFMTPPPLGIETLDAVCFVTQAPLARLSIQQKYIFDSILSIFGKDVASNIFVLITFADGAEPPVMKALEKANVPFVRAFPFNNSALFVSTEHPEKVPFGPMFWKMGNESFKAFFDDLLKTETKSLQLTTEVLHARQNLEITIQGLMIRINEGLHKINIIKEEQRQINQHKSDIEANKNFEYEVEIIHHEKVDLAAGEYVTNCLKCNRTCHFPCRIPNDSHKCRCIAMNSSGNCTICPKECIWSDHVNNTYRFKLYQEVVKKTFECLKKKYDIAREKEQDHTIYLQNGKESFNQISKEVFALIKEARNCINELNQKALKENPMSQEEYIQLLINSEKKELKFGWQRRVEMLEAFEKRAKLLKDIPHEDFRPWTEEEFEQLMHKSEYYDKGGHDGVTNGNDHSLVEKSSRYKKIRKLLSKQLKHLPFTKQS